MKYLGQGRMRIAFKIGSYALKIPKNINGIKACYEELVLWIKYKSDVMAPIVFSIPGLLVVMPYYNESFTGEKSEAFIKKLNRFGVLDLNKYNIRTHNGNPIVIDYAINKNTGFWGT